MLCIYISYIHGKELVSLQAFKVFVVMVANFFLLFFLCSFAAEICWMKCRILSTDSKTIIATIIVKKRCNSEEPLGWKCASAPWTEAWISGLLSVCFVRICDFEWKLCLSNMVETSGGGRSLSLLRSIFTKGNGTYNRVSCQLLCDCGYVQ